MTAPSHQARHLAGASRRQSAMAVALALSLAAPISACSDFRLFSSTEPEPDPVTVEELFEQAPLPQVDVLWVVDNTASMGEEQEALAQAFGSFIDALDGLDLAWQAGVITAQADGDQAGVLQGNPWIVHPDLDDPTAAFQQAVDVGTNGTGTGAEAGLGAAWLALTEPRISDENRGFRRAGASLHVVVLSDADDDSAAILGDDPASAFLDFLDEQAQANGAEAALSAVVATAPDDCDSAQYAATYVEVAQASGGAVESICDADFSDVAAAIGQASISWPTTFQLQAEPVVDSVSVRVDGLRQDDGWSVDAAASLLIFDEAPAAGAVIAVSYQLAEDAQGAEP